MKIAVMGAGAVGCYYGAMLARAGHQVVLIGRPSHVAAIEAHGLLLERHDFKGHVPATAATDPSAIAGAEFVLFCVKSTDTETAGRAIAGHLAAAKAVLSLQNGVDNAERLEAVLGRPVIPAVVYVGAEMAGPGHVKHNGRGELVIGEGPESAGLAALLTAAGMGTSVSTNVRAELWQKLIVNCAYNALSAIAQLPYGAMLAVPGTREVMANVIAECTAVAAACGVRLPAEIEAAVLAIGPRMPDQYSSTAQDLARGKRTEIAHLNGYVVKKGRELNIATPTNLVLQTTVELLESKLAQT